MRCEGAAYGWMVLPDRPWRTPVRCFGWQFRVPDRSQGRWPGQRGPLSRWPRFRLLALRGPAVIGGPPGPPGPAHGSRAAGAGQPGFPHIDGVGGRRVVRSVAVVALLIGGVAACVGSVMPWMVFGPIHLNGLSRDGVISLPLA